MKLSNLPVFVAPLILVGCKSQSVEGEAVAPRKEIDTVENYEKVVKALQALED